ncbi:MAG: aldehyde dehydrogenase, partial [Bdellovibrionia bacterium]
LSTDADLVLTLGCNEAGFRAGAHRVIASNTCDATAIGPVLGALARVSEIEDVSLTILHPWLNHQNLLDGRPPENSCGFELGRAAWGNVIPKTTSAESSLRAVLPEFKSISALSYRIPTPIVACADVTVRFRETVSSRDVLAGLKSHQSSSPFKIIGFNREPLVSSDFRGDEFSATIEERLLSVKGKLCKFALWYDNESGYAARVLDQVRYCGSGE